MTIVKTFEPVEQNKKFSKKYIVLVAAGLFMLVLMEIWANNNVVTYGQKLEKMSSLTKAISLENQVLENQIAVRGAMRNVASKSAELGFSEPESIQYIR